MNKVKITSFKSFLSVMGYVGIGTGYKMDLSPHFVNLNII